MNDPEELFAPAENTNGRSRRLSEPGRPSERLSPTVLRPRRESDAGRGYSAFSLRDRDRDMHRDTLRPRPATQQSMTSRSSGHRLSYAETSSATQSFVSFDTATDTPTHSAAAFSTASDAEHEHEAPQHRTANYDPMRHANPARSNTVYAPSAAQRQADPRRAATMGPDPRQAARSFGAHDDDSDDDDNIDPVPAVVLAADAGDDTVRGASPRRGARSSSTQQRRDAREAAAPSPPLNTASSSSAQGAPESDPRRSYKVSATPTIVPVSRSPAPRTDAPTPIQESGQRQRLPSAASNRTRPSTERPRPSTERPRPSAESHRAAPPAPPLPSPSAPATHAAADHPRPRVPSTASNRVAPTAPAPPPPKPAGPEHRPDPQTPTTVRPSTASTRPTVPPTPTPKPAPAPASEPRRAAAATATSAAAAIASPRPPLPQSASQMDTRYVNMLLAIDSIPALYNILASFFTWILLAGFVLFPGTFTSLQEDNRLGALGVSAVNVIKHLSLFVIAWVCTGIGAGGMCYLWYRWRKNYIWCLNRVFLPGLMNSLAGVLSTLASVLGAQNSTLSISSTSTIIVTSGIAGICGLLSAFYMFVLIRRLKREHDGEVGKQRAGKHGEGYADLSKRKGAGKMA